MTVCRNIICISFTSPSFCANLYIPGWDHAPNRRAMGRHLPFYELIELLHKEAKSVATQIRLVSNQKLTRIQGRAYRLNCRGRCLDFGRNMRMVKKTAAQLLK